MPPAFTKEQRKAEDFKKPEWFVCPMSSGILSGGQVEVPEGMSMAWEVELGVVIGKACHRVPVDKAMDYVAGYCVVLDMTGKSSGFDSMKYGFSWTDNKCVASFKPMGRFMPKSQIQDPHALTLVLKVNGEVVTRDTTSTFKFTIPEQVADASALTPLQRGDVLLTGAGALGDLNLGDKLEGFIDGMDAQYTVTAEMIAAKVAAAL